MAQFQGRSKRKKSGGKYRSIRGKRLYELGSAHLEVKIGETKRKTIRGKGGNIKVRALVLKEANVLDQKAKKYAKSEIVSVKENVANPHFVRRNTITKGAIIKTKAGLARVTNSPGQDGTVNAILVEQK